MASVRLVSVSVRRRTSIGSLRSTRHVVPGRRVMTFAAEILRYTPVAVAFDPDRLSVSIKACFDGVRRYVKRMREPLADATRHDLIRGALTADRLDAVKLIAGQLTVSLDNAQLYAEFRRIADEQAALRRVATLVARGVPPDLVFAAVAEEVGALFGVDAAAIVRFAPDGEATVMG